MLESSSRGQKGVRYIAKLSTMQAIEILQSLQHVAQFDMDPVCREHQFSTTLLQSQLYLYAVMSTCHLPTSELVVFKLDLPTTGRSWGGLGHLSRVI